ncbi:hypothetical protein Tco_1571975, partial [Tanacetum coccineum]
EDKTVPVSIYEVGESSTAAIPREDGDRLLPGFMRRDIDSFLVEWSIFQDDCVVARRRMHWSRRKERQRISFMNERVERDLYWTRVRAHEFYQEMIRRGFMFVEIPNEAINVPIKDEKSPLSEPQGSPPDAYIDAAIVAERERQAKARNDASGSEPVRGQDTVPAVRECTFAGFMKCNPTVFRGIEGVVELRRWFEKTESVFGISDYAEGKKVRFAAATLEGPALTWWNSKIATLGLETVN